LQTTDRQKITMKIAGWQKQSFIDYPGKISTVVFTQGCNFRCLYCHNSNLIPFEHNNYFSTEEVVSYCKKNAGLTDALVITGGEPTLQPDLINFIKEIKTTGLLVKIDTNGTNFDVIKKLLDLQIIDYIAMDIKTFPSLAEYKKITDNFTETHLNNIVKTIDIIKAYGNEYEFRTTVVKGIHNVETIKSIGKLIRSSQRWAIQNCRTSNTYRPMSGFPSFTEHGINVFAQIARQFVKEVNIRF